MTREEEIAEALRAMEPRWPDFTNPALTKPEQHRIDTVVDLLAPSRGKRERCRDDVGWRLAAVILPLERAAKYGIDHQGPTSKTMKGYVTALRRLQITGRNLTDEGGRVLIAQDIVDLMVKTGECALANGMAMPPRLEQIAVEMAHGLLLNWGRDITVSRLSPWHRVATALLGVPNKSIDLRRIMSELLKEQVAQTRLK